MSEDPIDVAPETLILRIAELEAAQAAARRAIGHDLGSQLRNIDALAMLAQDALTEDGRAADGEVAACLARVRSCAGDARALCAGLSAYLKAFDPPEQAARTRLADAAARACAASPAVRAGLAFEIEGDGAALVEEDRLIDVLGRLLENAAQRGGARRVRISVERPPSAALIVLRLADDGIGVASQHAERIFEPFARLDEGGGAETAPRRGPGLGLAICRAALRAMGGELALETGPSAPAQGAAFALTLIAAPG